MDFSWNFGVVRRSAGRSAVAAAAYCSRSRLHDVRLDAEHGFSTTFEVVHSGILLPDGAPGRWLDRAALWNEVEAVEGRSNAQLAVEIDIAMPEELSEFSRVGLARDFFLAQFVASGRVVDLNIHRALAADGTTMIYAQAMLTIRDISGDGFAEKKADWYSPNALLRWRERWALLANRRFIESGLRTGINERLMVVSGRDFESPDAAGSDGVSSAGETEILWRNGERIISEPVLVLDGLLRERSSFTRGDLARFVKARTAGEDQFSKALARVESSVEIVRLGTDDRGDDLYTKRGAAGAGLPAEGSGAPIGVGENGTLRDAADVWEAAGLRLRGVGITYEEARAFERKTGIVSVGAKGLFKRWMKKEDRLESKDVLVVNDASKFDGKHKEWMLFAARVVKAKLVLVDGSGFKVIDGGDIGLDAEQLAAFAARA